MGRSTFEGPVLAGDIRFGNLRNVGTTVMAQSISMVLTNTTPNTANYGGSSGVFVDSNGIPNAATPVYTPGTTTYAAQTVTADTASLIHRGAVFFLPVGSELQDILIDMQAVPTTAAGTVSNVICYVSNQFETSSARYFQTGPLTVVGRAALSTFTATQMGNQQATPNDIVQAGNQPNVSQVVVTLQIAGTSMTTLTAGTFNIVLRYSIPDTNIGNTTTYPYGNFD